jgi:hypothetical protein
MRFGWLAKCSQAKPRSLSTTRKPHQTEAVMLGICLTVGLVIAGQGQAQEKDVTTRPWAVIAKRHAMATKVYPTDDPTHPFARRLAERFSADLVDRKNVRFHLRLLTTPLHRYDTIDSLISRGGALFAFCQQTDPELLLLIEARKSGAGYRWEYAVAGFSNMDLYLRLDGSEVWRDVPAFSSGRGAHSFGRVRFVNTAELEAAKREKLEK